MKTTVPNQTQEPELEATPASDDAAPAAGPVQVVIPTRVYISVAFFIILSGGLYQYWLTVPCVNSLFPRFYPRLGSELPGPFLSTPMHDNWDWWIFAVTHWNALPPMVLAMAVTHRSLHEYAFAHSFVSVWAFLANLFVIVAGAVRWVGFCNTSGSGYSTSCNSDLWCCVYWPSEWCPNNGACIFTSGAVIAAGDLHRSPEMTQTWAFAFVFFLMAFWHLRINHSLGRDWGFWPASERYKRVKN